MKLLFRVIITALVSLSTMGVTVTPAQAKKQPELLFFQHANTGSIQIELTSGCYQLRLDQVDKEVVYLSTSPEKITGTLSIEAFMTSWKHDKKTENIQPNAILHATLINEGKTDSQISDVFVLERSNYQAKDDTLTYTICPLKKGAKFKTGQLVNINVFVDPFHRWPP